MKPMNGLDAAFLYGETPNWHMHVAAVTVCDPTNSVEQWTFQRFKEITTSRLALIPQFRCKVAQSPLGIGRPGWVLADDFDPDFHIRRIAVPSPGGPHELGELVGDLASLKLDRSKPLWEMWVIEGLAGGRIGLLTKVHHALIDGVSGAELATVLLDVSPIPKMVTDAPPIDPDYLSKPTAMGWIRGGAMVTLKTPLRTIAFTRQLARWGVTLPTFMRRDEGPAMPFQAPRTSLNSAISPHRRYAHSQIELERVRALKDALGVKVNDIVLALCSYALRGYLEERGELPETPLIAQVPVSQRGADEKDLGNKVASMFASLATDVADPIERVHVIHASTQQAKEMQQALAARRIQTITEATPPGILSIAARTYTAMGLDGRVPPIFNVIMSNVPGPPFPLYVSGARVESITPMGPLLYGGGLNITVLSHEDVIDFGFLSCREAVPDPWLIADKIEKAVSELEKAVAGLKAPKKKAPAKSVAAKKAAKAS
ncbi:MAG: wax ester/triacylglycerol synthase family O-acyltransferase [Acidimicrobiia bacterium]